MAKKKKARARAPEPAGNSGQAVYLAIYRDNTSERLGHLPLLGRPCRQAERKGRPRIVKLVDRDE